MKKLLFLFYCLPVILIGCGKQPGDTVIIQQAYGAADKEIMLQIIENAKADDRAAQMELVRQGDAIMVMTEAKGTLVEKDGPLVKVLLDRDGLSWWFVEDFVK